MTRDEFNKTAWGCGMRAIYNNHVYVVASCDFTEALIALADVTQGSDAPNWVRCENIELITG